MTLDFNETIRRRDGTLTDLIGFIEENGGTPITIDSSLSDSSENPVQNRVITTALAGILGFEKLGEISRTISEGNETFEFSNYGAISGSHPQLVLAYIRDASTGGEVNQAWLLLMSDPTDYELNSHIKLSSEYNNAVIENVYISNNKLIVDVTSETSDIDIICSVWHIKL